MTTILNARAVDTSPAPTAWSVDTSRGQLITRVSREWASRPDDQRYLNLADLDQALRARADACRDFIVPTERVSIDARLDDDDSLMVRLPDGRLANPSHWAFGQLAQQAAAPAGYLRTLPAPIAGIALQYGLAQQRDAVKFQTFERDGDVQLRSVTGPAYGRIFDHRLVAAVRKIAGNGTGDTRWKVPGCINWQSRTYNPHVDITKETTTLYASDRDVFLFLVDDLNPIEAGRLPDGSPDLFFRGFFAWNSEVGSRTLGIATFYLRGVCQNRCLWGVEQFREIRIRHTKNAADRFAYQVAPVLRAYAESSPQPFIAAMNKAQARVVAKTDEEGVEFLQRQKFTQPQAQKILETVFREEGHPARTLYDMVQGITALARTRPHQDDRLALETRAKSLIDRTA
jgi:hypothetical protein